MGGVGQGREGEGLAVGHAEGEGGVGAAAGGLLLQRQGAGADVDAAVLRDQVGGDMGLLAPAAEGGAFIAVGVGLARQAGPADPGGGLRGGHPDAKDRQLGRAGRAVVDAVHPQGAAGDGVADVSRRPRHGGEGEGVPDADAAGALLLHLPAGRLGVGVGGQPGGAALREAAAPVVLGGGPPEGGAGGAPDPLGAAGHPQGGQPPLAVGEL